MKKNPAAVALGKKGGQATCKNKEAARATVNKNLALARKKRWAGHKRKSK